MKMWRAVHVLGTFLMCGVAATSVSGQRGGPPQAPPTAKAAASNDPPATGLCRH